MEASVYWCRKLLGNGWKLYRMLPTCLEQERGGGKGAVSFSASDAVAVQVDEMTHGSVCRKVLRRLRHLVHHMSLLVAVMCPCVLGLHYSMASSRTPTVGTVCPTVKTSFTIEYIQHSWEY